MVVGVAVDGVAVVAVVVSVVAGVVAIVVGTVVVCVPLFLKKRQVPSFLIKKQKPTQHLFEMLCKGYKHSGWHSHSAAKSAAATSLDAAAMPTLPHIADHRKISIAGYCGHSRSRGLQAFTFLMQMRQKFQIKFQISDVSDADASEISDF